MDTNKVVLLLHGWPNTVADGSFPVRYFKSKGFTVLNPKWFVLRKPISMEGLVKTLSNTLENTKPDVIVGFSAGGLIAPHLADLYPQSRLILVATGPFLNPKSLKYKLLLKEVNTNLLFPLLGTAKKIPMEKLKKIYEKLYPNNIGQDDESYMEDMNRNLDAIRNADEVLKDNSDFIRKIDNTQFLPKIQNKTLIISMDEDPLMPVELGRELNRLIKGSVFHIVHASHFDLFNKDAAAVVDIFLE
jgi:pimeloyl-ACP methyl ester carboxylesterase